MTPPDLSEFVASVCLDEFDRYAKAVELIETVRLYYPAGQSPDYLDIPYDDFLGFTEATRDAIMLMPSAAGRLDTEGKSNA